MQTIQLDRFADPAAMGASGVAAWARLRQRIAAWREARRTEAALRGLDPRILVDVGIAEGMVDWRPRWGAGHAPMPWLTAPHRPR